MRTCSALALLIGLAFVVASPAAAQNRIDRGLPANPDASIRIYNNVGSVRIIGWNRDSIAVRGTLGKGNELHFGGGRTGVKMFVEGSDERNPAPAAIEVMVPQRSKVWVKTASADIEVSGVTGSLDLYVIGGRISVTGNPGDLNAESIDGSIKVLGRPGWIRAKSASGDVTLDGSSADATLSTVSGRIDADGTGYEKAKFETITGGIRFAGSLQRGGLVTFESHSGPIEVGIPAGGGADFDVVSIAGPITNRLTSSRPVKGRYGRGAELATSSGGGGTRVSIRSFKGSVTLKRLD